MSKFIKDKELKVSELKNLIIENKSFLIFEYSGLSAQEISMYRKKFREYNSKFIIQKNNIINRSLLSLSIWDKPLSGPNAILFTGGNFKPFQEIAKLSKEKDSIKLKLAYFDNEIISDENLNLLSTLSSKEDLLAKFSRLLLLPLYKFTNAVKKIDLKS